MDTMFLYEKDRLQENAIVCIIFRDQSDVNEWKLVYLPKNIFFETLLNRTAQMLDLEVISVSNSEQIEDCVKNQGIFAGIEFDHPNVMLYNFL